MRALLGLGANLGDPVATLNEAKSRLGRLGVVTAASALYRTPPWGVLDQPPFVNAALALDTALDPGALLAALKALERELGRVAGVRYGRGRSIWTSSTCPASAATIRTSHHPTRACSSVRSLSCRWRRSNRPTPRRAMHCRLKISAAVERIGAFDREGEPR